MTHTVYWTAPLAVLAVLLLVRYVGCDLVFTLDDVTDGAYDDDVRADSPVAYWRLADPTTTAVPGGTIVDDRGNFDGQVLIAQNPLPDDPATLSPPADPITFELRAQPGLIEKANGTDASIRVRGGFVGVPFTPQLNTPQFSIEALVRPEWDLLDASKRGRYYAVIESTDSPAAGAGQSKRTGFALYAGPTTPTALNSPYRWQLWVGDGTGFRQLQQTDTAKAPPVALPQTTYLCATFDGTRFTLYFYFSGRDMDQLAYDLTPVSYVPNTTEGLLIGGAGARRSLIAPFPGPQRFLYPFVGQIQEVAYYDHALTPERVFSHGINAFRS